MKKQFHLEGADNEQRGDQDRHAQVYREDDFDDTLVQRVDQYRFPFDVQGEDQDQRDDRQNLNNHRKKLVRVETTVELQKFAEKDSSLI